MALVRYGPDEGYYPDPTRVLVCYYNDEATEGGIRGYSYVHFWDSCRAAPADPERLAARLTDHTLLMFGPPRNDCPATLEEAVAAHRQPEPNDVEICEFRLYTPEQLAEIEARQAREARQRAEAEVQTCIVLINLAQTSWRHYQDMPLNTLVMIVDPLISTFHEGCHERLDADRGAWDEGFLAVYDEIMRLRSGD